MKDSNVNLNMARDLKSTAGDLPKLQDRVHNQTAEEFEHGKGLLSQKAESQRDDLRSLRSEYDYGSKKKFVDVLLNVKNSDLTSQRLKK